MLIDVPCFQLSVPKLTVSNRRQAESHLKSIRKILKTDALQSSCDWLCLDPDSLMLSLPHQLAWTPYQALNRNAGTCLFFVEWNLTEKAVSIIHSSSWYWRREDVCCHSFPLADLRSCKAPSRWCHQCTDSPMPRCGHHSVSSDSSAFVHEQGPSPQVGHQHSKSVAKGGRTRCSAPGRFYCCHHPAAVLVRQLKSHVSHLLMVKMPGTVKCKLESTALSSLIYLVKRWWLHKLGNRVFLLWKLLNFVIILQFALEWEYIYCQTFYTVCIVFHLMATRSCWSALLNYRHRFLINLARCLLW